MSLKPSDSLKPGRAKDRSATSSKGAIASPLLAVDALGDDRLAVDIVDTHAKENLTLPERSDELERRLGMALKAYRQRAEEILDQHMEALEKSQVSYDHEISMLKAENAKLREIIGKKDDASFPQNVFFQSAAAVEQPSSKKDAKQKMKANEDDDDKKVLSTKGKKGKKGEEQPGGSWQNFVAWVPNGAALGNPEPWKPLPPQAIPPGTPGAGALKSQKSWMGGGGGTTHGNLTPVLPGQVPDNKNKKDKVDDDDDSDYSKDSNEEDMGKLEILEVWKPTEKELRNKNKGFAGDADSHYSADKGDDEFKEPPHSIFIVNPDSNIRIVWDLSSLFMVVYDMIMIPMAVFDMPDGGFLSVMSWTTRIFWTLDMGASCCTAVGRADGSVEYNMRFIMKRYLKSWFGLDIIIVGSDWFGVIFASGGMGLGRLARVSRTIRVVRLLRLARMQEVIANITERIQSDQVMLCLQGFKIMVVLIFSCHVIACGWWGVGSSSSPSWINNYNYKDADTSLQYLVCLHWALMQFSGGMDEMTPTRGFERFFCVIIWIFAFMAGLVMLSFLTSKLTQQYIIGGSGARQMATLKKYLKQNKIPKNLIKRLCRSAKHAVSGDLQPETVDLLNVVSEPLKIEMHYEMYSRVLHSHPFFLDFLTENNQVMRRVCHSCMSMLLLDSGDVLFRKGDEANEPKMYFVCSGTLEYLDKYEEITTVVDKQWAAEACLWCAWRHQGTLSAISDAKIAMLDAELFAEVCNQYIKKSKGNAFNPKKYAAAFVDELNKCTDLTDLQHDG